MPTEEVFTTPHKDRAEGTVTATKPLSHQGTMIEGIQVRFEKGRIVEAHATRGEEVLQKLIDTDEGARRLGEVALVPHSSPIASQRNALFQHAVRRECRIAYCAGASLLIVPARWRQADSGSSLRPRAPTTA